MRRTHLAEKSGPPIKIRCTIADRLVVKTTLEHAPLFEAWIEADSESSLTAETVMKWLHRYCRKKGASAFPIELVRLQEISGFYQNVLKTLCQIPFGQVASYAEIATLVGSPRASRAVGTACGRNPLPLLIPCHRVVSSGGGLGGFSLDPRIKRDLLDFESRAEFNGS